MRCRESIPVQFVRGFQEGRQFFLPNQRGSHAKTERSTRNRELRIGRLFCVEGNVRAIGAPLPHRARGRTDYVPLAAPRGTVMTADAEGRRPVEPKQDGARGFRGSPVGRAALTQVAG